MILLGTIIDRRQYLNIDKVTSGDVYKVQRLLSIQLYIMCVIIYVHVLIYVNKILFQPNLKMHFLPGRLKYFNAYLQHNII